MVFCDRRGPMAKRPAIQLRILLTAETVLGPGKADLLEGVQETGSIAAASRRMGMSYKRAWYLIDTMNSYFKEPLVVSTKGGKAGGGAKLTATGSDVLKRYRRMEADAEKIAVRNLAALAALARRKPA
jgi:molybdate transport system regulatory protein